MKTLLLLCLIKFHAEALIFDCAYNSIVWTHIGIFTYSCQVRAVSSYGNIFELENVTGVHTYGMDKMKVEALDISNLTLHRIPRNLSDHFPSLIVIQCYNTSLQEVSSGDLQPFPALRLLSLPRNQIIVLSGDLFQYSSKLKYIGFGYNVIEKIDEKLVEDLLSLEFADFRGNSCIDVSVDGRWNILQLSSTFKSQCSTSTTTDSSTTISECNTECFRKLENAIVSLQDLQKVNERKIQDLEAKLERVVLS